MFVMIGLVGAIPLGVLLATLCDRAGLPVAIGWIVAGAILLLCLIAAGGSGGSGEFYRGAG